MLRPSLLLVAWWLRSPAGAAGAAGAPAPDAVPDAAAAQPPGRAVTWPAAERAESRALVQEPAARREQQALAAAVHIVSSVRSATPEALKQEIVAAEAALSLRAEVDGAPAVYDSPAVSISLRKVSPHLLVEAGASLDAVDGAGVKIPADPRIKGRHGGPVTISITSYHTGDAIKELPTVKYGAEREMRRVSGAGSISATKQKEDRVDFFMSKTSVSWRGTVNVKVPGLSAQVPAHDRPWVPYGDEGGDALFREEKEQVRQELEALLGQPAPERARGLRRLQRRWHPDKNPEDQARATEVFEFLQTVKEALAV